MGCSSCGQKYSGSARARSRRYFVARRNGRKVKQMVPEEKTQGMIQPDVAEGIPVPVPDIPIIAATGQPVAMVTGEQIPENALGDTAPQPNPIGVEECPSPGHSEKVE